MAHRNGPETTEKPPLLRTLLLRATLARFEIVITLVIVVTIHSHLWHLSESLFRRGVVLSRHGSCSSPAKRLATGRKVLALVPERVAWLASR
jgi:hypothetical protein